MKTLMGITVLSIALAACGGKAKKDDGMRKTTAGDTMETSSSGYGSTGYGNTTYGNPCGGTPNPCGGM